MVDEGRSGGMMGSSMNAWEDRGGVAAGTILATALAAGVIAYLLRRSREQEKPSNRIARLASDWSSTESVEIGRDFFMAKVLPELKPAMLAILSEFEDVIDQAFRRAEKSIKKL